MAESEWESEKYTSDAVDGHLFTWREDVGTERSINAASTIERQERTVQIRGATPQHGRMAATRTLSSSSKSVTYSVIHILPKPFTVHARVAPWPPVRQGKCVRQRQSGNTAAPSVINTSIRPVRVENEQAGSRD